MSGRPASYVILLGLALSPAALVSADDASALGEPKGTLVDLQVVWVK
jgi:hypothetical protein